MTAIQKHMIIETLNSMDKTQMERVLQFAKGISNHISRETAYEAFKRNALMEIRQALKENM